MTRQELSELNVMEVVEFKTKNSTPLVGKVWAVNPNSDSIYGENLKVVIRPIDKTWFGALEITSHGDYGSIKYSDLEYVK